MTTVQPVLQPVLKDYLERRYFCLKQVQAATINDAVLIIVAYLTSAQ